MAINIDNANAYFATRTVVQSWQEYSVEQRTAAIEQAKRDLSRALGRPMREDEPQYAFGDETRDEYAVYEQAIYTLLRDANPKGSESDIPSLNPDERADPRTTMKTGSGKWSEEALAWLGASGRVQTILC